jgi:hypothetical protein
MFCSLAISYKAFLSVCSQTIDTRETHGLLLDVDLDKLGVGELCLELAKVWRDEFTWAAPGGPVVDNHDVVAGNLEGALV